MADLPEHVLERILSKLPVKSLLRFKCASKSCLSLLSSPYFTNLHFKQSSLSHKIVCSVNGKLQSFDPNLSWFGSDSAFKTLNFPVNGSLQLMGSYGGLVCVYERLSKNLFLWNPSTGAYKKLPSFFDDNTSIYKNGFGYDKSLDDYKLVFFYWDVKDQKSCACVYSHNSHSWKIVADQEYGDIFGHCEKGLFFDGALYWVSNHKIWVFDLASESFKTMPLPGPHMTSLVVVQGRLCCLANTSTYKKILWTAYEYGHEGTWTKVTTISCMPSGYRLATPICSSHSGEIIFSVRSCRLVKIDLMRNTFIPGSVCYDYPGEAAYTETLISP